MATQVTILNVLKLAYQAGRASKNMWTEKHGDHPEYTFNKFIEKLNAQERLEQELIDMDEIKNQLSQTGFTLDRLHQDKKISDEAYTILKERNKQAKELDMLAVSSCYAIFDEDENIIRLYQTEEKADKAKDEFKMIHKDSEFYVETIQIH